MLAAGPALAVRPAGGDAVIGMQLEPPILDPTRSPAASITEIEYGNVFEGLVSFAPDGSAQPALAESWEVSGDGLRYVFHLRAGVRFHDGTRFDASTAKYSLERALAPGSLNPQKPRLAAVGAIEAADALTLRLVLKRRSGGLLQSLAWGAFAMVAPASAAGNALHPVGTGPFEFSAWRRGDSISFVRNEHYWGRPAPLSRVTFKFIGDPTAAYAALMAGDIDAFSNYPAPESIAQFRADRRFRVFVGQTEGETLLSLNNRRPPFDDLRVRRAISHALDRPAIIDGAMYGFGTPIGSHFPPQNPAYVDLTGRYPHDPGTARELLREAGYPHGFTAVLKLPPPSYARRSGEIVAAQLAAVGIRVSIENLEWAQWLDQVFTRHDFDMSIVSHAEPMDYDIYARDDYYFGYSNPRFKALMADLEDSIDAGRRRELLGLIQRQLAEDAVNGFLFQYPELDVADAHLQGLGFGGVLDVVDLRDAHFDGEAAGGRRPGTAGRSAAGDADLAVPGTMFAGIALLLVIFAGRRFGPAYVVRRLAVLAATLVAASAVVFVIVQVVPGDPARYMMGLQAQPDAVAALRHELGLDTPAPQRYLAWVGGLLHGNFGLSYTYRVPVGTLIAQRLQVSAPLAAYALALSTLVAVPIGVAAAARRGRAADVLLTGAAQLGLAVPNFWLGMILAWIFAINLHWVPAGGFSGLASLTLPAVALAMPQAAILALVLRASLLDTLHEDYVRTARAKGAGEWRILWRHALPNALIPVMTILGMQFSFLLAGGVIIENVFFLPGLGRLVFQAIVQRDLMVVQSVVVLLAFAVVLVSFVVDLSYVLIDPRLRARRGA
jgi:ABC-type dipeptide/oligopeptide/nickel transport system permease component/ABC-type transport system substrate-binding protein